MRIRVVTLNIWNEEGDSARRLELINRELRALRPDLLALQEVVHSDERSQLSAPLDGTGLHATHQAETAAVIPPHATGFGGNAIATRWPHRIVEVADLRMSDTPDVPRSFHDRLVSVFGRADYGYANPKHSYARAEHGYAGAGHARDPGLASACAPDVPWFALAALVSLPELGDILFIAPTCRQVR